MGIFSEDLHNRYRSGVGLLLYLVKHQQSGLSNTVGYLSKLVDEAKK